MILDHDWLCFAGAAVLHLVGVPVAYAIAPEPPVIQTRLREKEPYEVDVDVDSAFIDKAESDNFRVDRDLAPSLGMRDSTSPPNADYDPTKPATMNRGRAGARVVDDPNAVLANPDANADTGNDTWNADGDWGNAPGPGVAWGIPGTDPNLPYWALPGAPGVFTDGPDGPGAPTRTKPRKYDPDAPTTAVQDAVRAKDRKLGLDFPGRGPIRNAFVSATYGSDAPYECKAMFGLSVSPKGQVTNVTYLSHTGGTAGTWKKVAQAAQAQLKSAKLVMRSAFKKGATVSVVVVSKKKPVGGGTSRDGATINFDVADIGTKDVRIVSAAVAPTPVK